VSRINAIKRKPPQKHTTHFKQTTGETIKGVNYEDFKKIVCSDLEKVTLLE
jgi:hypothetical protein